MVPGYILMENEQGGELGTRKKEVFVVTAIELWYHYVRQSKESATGRVILGGGKRDLFVK